MSLITALADAVVERLNGADLSIPFTAERQFAPVHDLADLADLHVTIVPKAMSIEAHSRHEDRHEYQVDIALQQRITGDGDIATLLGLGQEVSDLFRRAELTAAETRFFVSAVASDPIYDAEGLREERVFTGVITLTCLTAR